MKVAFDTNVLLDTILNRPGREDALRLMLAVSEEKFVGVVSANSITDMYAKHWAYEAIMEAANGHTAVLENEAETWER